MAKDKGSKFLLPKRIGGFKIPKKVRKSGGPILEFLDTPHGRETAAGALVSIAASLMGREWVRDAANSVGDQPAPSGSVGGSAGGGIVREVAAVAANPSPPSPVRRKRSMASPGGRRAALATTSLTSPADTEGVDRKRP